MLHGPWSVKAAMIPCPKAMSISSGGGLLTIVHKREVLEPRDPPRYTGHIEASHCTAQMQHLRYTPHSG